LADQQHFKVLRCDQARDAQFRRADAIVVAESATFATDNHCLSVTSAPGGVLVGRFIFYVESRYRAPRPGERLGEGRVHQGRV